MYQLTDQNDKNDKKKPEKGPRQIFADGLKYRSDKNPENLKKPSVIKSNNNQSRVSKNSGNRVNKANSDKNTEKGRKRKIKGYTKGKRKLKLIPKLALSFLLGMSAVPAVSAINNFISPDTEESKCPPGYTEPTTVEEFIKSVIENETDNNKLSQVNLALLKYKVGCAVGKENMKLLSYDDVDALFNDPSIRISVERVKSYFNDYDYTDLLGNKYTDVVTAYINMGEQNYAYYLRGLAKEAAVRYAYSNKLLINKEKLVENLEFTDKKVEIDLRGDKLVSEEKDTEKDNKSDSVENNSNINNNVNEKQQDDYDDYER